MTIISDALIPDVENHIFFWTDNRSLVALSCTSKKAYEILTNEGIFKKRFDELYKWMVPTPGILFPHLQENYPDCCWKIASCLYPDEQPIVVFNKTFLQASESYQKATKGAGIEVLVLQNELQEICGIGFADPNSRIHQAWENFNAAAASRNEFFNTPDCLDHTTANSISTQYFEASKHFNDLEEKRSIIENRIVALQPDNLKRDVLVGLLVDQYFSKNPFLITNKHRYSFGWEFNKITSEILYHACANGVIEDNWADNHQDEHLPHLDKIRERLELNAQNFKADYLAHLEAGMENYVSQHSESFSQVLPLLQESLASYKDALQKLNNDTKNTLDFYSIYDNAVFSLTDKINQDFSSLPEITVYLEFLDIIIDRPGFYGKEYFEKMLEQRVQIFELLVKYSPKPQQIII